jgi:hypothetical protein
MTNPETILTVTAFSLTGLAIFTATTLRGWSQWLELKRIQLGVGADAGLRPGGRSELTDLRARVRKLEAIANGTDL